jgi:transposase
MPAAREDSSSFSSYAITGWDAFISFLLPPPKPRRSRYPGRKPLDDRAVLTGILFILQTGLRWDLLPRERWVAAAA